MKEKVTISQILQQGDKLDMDVHPPQITGITNYSFTKNPKIITDKWKVRRQTDRHGNLKETKYRERIDRMKMAEETWKENPPYRSHPTEIEVKRPYIYYFDDNYYLLNRIEIWPLTDKAAYWKPGQAHQKRVTPKPKFNVWFEKQGWRYEYKDHMRRLTELDYKRTYTMQGVRDGEPQPMFMNWAETHNVRMVGMELIRIGSITQFQRFRQHSSDYVKRGKYAYYGEDHIQDTVSLMKYTKNEIESEEEEITL